VNSGKAYGAAIIVAQFAFSCTLFPTLTALISEEQNWRKQIYENPNAYVGSDLDVECSRFCPRHVI
jgi:hypothetical protein